MQLSQRIEAFTKLGQHFRAFGKGSPAHSSTQKLSEAALQAEIHNPWFTQENIQFAFSSLAGMLQKDALVQWANKYGLQSEPSQTKTVAVVMAGNIPMVGFHDMLSILIFGYKILVKFSSKDRILMKAVVDLLLEIEPAFADYITITQAQLKDFDAVIATGSDNSSRYFDYYFSKYPHIIRGNRNSLAILRGDETQDELKKLSEDIFCYFGLGCRSISKLFLPMGFDLMRLFEAFADHEHLSRHTRYQNNFDYQRAVYLMNKVPHEASGFVILREDEALTSPISVINFERYEDLKAVHAKIDKQRETIQCIVGKKDMHPEAFAFGESQSPALWDYADNVDTIKFLQEL